MAITNAKLSQRNPNEGMRPLMFSEEGNDSQNSPERKAVVSRLRAQHGPNWAQNLGVKSTTDTPTLKSLLHTASTNTVNSRLKSKMMDYGKVRRA